jgi:archaeal type IV pilus assembly protein PilA
MTTRKYMSGNENAVSPVVGVMLMVVVVVIIAAVVAGFAGGLIGKVNENAPSLSMDIKVINTGSWSGSGFFATITGVSKPISTNDLKIITTWSATNRTSYVTITGGNTTLPGSANVKALGDPATLVNLTAPFGSGPGVNGSVALSSRDTDAANLSSRWQQFGNYSLMAGTTLTAQPCGGSLDTGTKAATGYGVTNLFQYEPAGEEYADPATAVLGPQWESLRAGDRVNVKVIYVPTGSVIFQKDIAVTEG